MARDDRQSLPVQPSIDRLDRRVVLKAVAAFSAMAAFGASAGKVRPAAAQEAAETLAATWYESDRLVGYTLPSIEDTVIQADFPFYAVAPHWDGAVGGWPRIEMSFSADGLTWGEAVVVGASDHDAGRPDRNGRAFGHLVFTDQSSYIRYRSLDEAGNSIQVPGLAFTYIDASPGPGIDAVYAAALDPSVERPPIISRNAWGANERYRYEDGEVDWPPDYQAVEHVIIHHTEGPNFEDPLVAIRSIYYYHAVTRGWGDIGYNYLVDFMGNVYEGRYGGDNVVGGHAFQYAYGSSGIGTMGSFSGEGITPEMQAGLVWITAWLARDLDPYGVSDFHEVPNLPTICAHRDVNQTDCPGDFLYGDVQTIRNLVSAVLFEGATPGPEAGEFAPGDAVKVIVDGANLRSSPGLDGWVAAELPLGTVLAVADGPTTTDGYAWYQVAGAAGAGWTASFALQRTDQIPPPMPGRFAPGDEVVVITDALKLRDAPALAGGVLAILPTGTTATIADGPTMTDGYAWYALDSDYGNGWSVGEFLGPPGTELPPSPDADFAAGDRVTVDTDAINLRAAPGLDAQVIATLPNGTSGIVLAGPEWATGTAWYRLETSSGDGWGVAGYLAFAPSPSGGEAVLAPGDEVVVATDALNLRAAPSSTGAVIAVLPTGARLSIVGGPAIEDGLTWYQVTSTTYGTGWSAGQFLGGDPEPTFASGQTVRVIDGELNLRAEPSLSAAVLAILPDGAELTIDYGPSNHDGIDWWYIDGPAGGGWTAGDFLVAT